MECKDQLVSTLKFLEIPKRIVCLVPSLTELLVDLGLEENIVGVTKFCVHPTHIRKEKKIVGGTKNVNFDRIQSLQPDFILCNKEENTKEIVTKCKAISNTYVSDIYEIKDVLELIKDLGNIFNCNSNAVKILTSLKSKLDNFNPINQKKKVAYFIWKDPWMVAANSTFINHLLNINGFENVYQSKERYPEVTLTELAEIKDLDFVFLSSEPYPFKETHVKLLKHSFPNSKILIVDGEFFSWYGSRLIKAFEYFWELQKMVI